MIRAVWLFVWISALVACSRPPAADTPASPVASPVRQAAPTRPVKSTQPRDPSPTTLPPSPTPPAGPVPLGQSVTIDSARGERYTILVHGMRRQPAEPALGITEPLVLVDWSVRNDGDRSVSWRAHAGKPTILAADGTPLNAEPVHEGVPLQVADMGDQPTACRGENFYTTQPFADFLTTSGSWFMPPGAVYRTWTAFV